MLGTDASDGPDAVSTANRPTSTVTFRGGLVAPLALAAAFAALATLSVLVGPSVTDPGTPGWVQPAWSVAKFAALGLVGMGVLRLEGVTPGALGFSWSLLGPAGAAFAGLWVALNGLAVGVAAATGNPWGIDVLLDFEASTVAFQFLVVGLLEELVFRGYLQTKVLALLGDHGRGRVALGVVVASLAFGLMHAPAVVVAGGSLPAVAAVVLARAGTGLAFGAVYEWTGNLWLLTLLHGLGNTWVLAGDWTAWPVEPIAAFLGGALVLYVITVVGYRRWMEARGRPVEIRRTERPRSSPATGESTGS